MLVLLALPGTARAQSEDTGAWFSATAIGKLPQSSSNPSPWRWWLEGQARFGDDASTFAQGILRPALGYAIDRRWTVFAGYAYIRTNPPYSAATTNENRIWQQLSWSGTAGTTGLSSRTRLEQRFVSSGNQTGWRLRELVKISQPLGSKSIWRAVVSDEYFLNLRPTDDAASAGSDRNRFFAGSGVKFSETVLLEFGYLNQYTFSSTGARRIDHIFSTSLSLSF